MTLPTIKPMLAAPSTATGSRRAVTLESLFTGSNAGKYLADLKLDGLRCILYWDGSIVRLVNRSGVDITRKFPEVEAVAPALGAHPVILDGELVCASGLFNDVATRGKTEKAHDIAARTTSMPARFIAFDLLHLGGADLRAEPYSMRRAQLSALIRTINDPAVIASIASTDGMAFWNSVCKLGLEGLIAKDLEAPYMEGKRSPAWRKFKTVRTLSCIAVSYEPGTGARAHFGAMQLVVLKDGKPHPVGDVGTGFNATEIAWLKGELDNGRMPIVEIEALNLGSNGRLRFPVYRGSRQDIAHTDCTYDQLAQFPTC